MKKESHKEILLNALVTIRAEYIAKTHQTLIDCCALCKIYNKNNHCIDCGCCPMTVFKGYANYPCMNRQCEPIDVYKYQNPTPRQRKYYDNKLAAVVEFYNRLIKKVKKMSEEEILSTDWQSINIIDKNVGKKFGVQNSYPSSYTY
jgi:hypothetical protein